MLNDLRIAVLCSQRAPALEALLAHPHADLAAIITTDPAAAKTLQPAVSCVESGVPVICRPNVPKRRERVSYDAATAELLTRLDVDYVFCLGYLYVLTGPMLAAFPERIVNIHDADLTRPLRFPGLHATRDAILAGERATRSTLHLVNEDLDGGPVLYLSDPYAVAPFVRDAVRAGAGDIVRAYAYAHREWMMRDAWPRLVTQTMNRFAATPVEAIA
jgi:phosphoribosylglycinamide formyltransferase-1